MDERFYHLSANYTGEPDSWSNNFLNLEVNFKKELSEMHSDFRTTLIVAQDLDNASIYKPLLYNDSEHFD